MKVLLVNGSPHKKGSTYAALSEVEAALQANGIETEFFWVGTEPLAGCVGCRMCGKLGKCVVNDKVNLLLERAAQVDGFVFGSPVHFAAISASMTALLDRAFYADFCAPDDVFYLKPAAAVVVARRAGTTAALDQLLKYPSHADMPVITSRYWNMAHGASPGDVQQDGEGLQTLRELGNNMAFFLKCKEAGLRAGIISPTQEPRVVTNFIR